MPNGSLKELLASSNLAFTGTVETVGATTVADVPVNDRTVVVQVGEVLRGPPEVGVPPGSRVTVQLSAELPPLNVGDQRTFFANGWVYGENLAVIEVGRSAVEEAAAPTARMAGRRSRCRRSPRQWPSWPRTRWSSTPGLPMRSCEPGWSASPR